MAASMLRSTWNLLRSFRPGVIVDSLRGGLLGDQAVRNASKKAASYSRNKRKRTPGKGYGKRLFDGTFVHNGQQLIKQRRLDWYPGENVRYAKDNGLYAMRDGIVMTSYEKLSPYPTSPLYSPVQRGSVIHKKFFHIIPTPIHPKFRLVPYTSDLKVMEKPSKDS